MDAYIQKELLCALTSYQSWSYYIHFQWYQAILSLLIRQVDMTLIRQAKFSPSAWQNTKQLIGLCSSRIYRFSYSPVFPPPTALSSHLGGLEGSRTAWMGDGIKHCSNLSLPTWSCLPFHPLWTSGRGTVHPREELCNTLPQQALTHICLTSLQKLPGNPAMVEKQTYSGGGMTPSQGRTKIVFNAGYTSTIF